MSEREAEFLRRLRAAFLAEARDHLQAISDGLLALEGTGELAERAQSIEGVFRHTHSLKGSARAAGFADVERLCQELEDLFALCKRHGRALSAGEFDTLYRAIDLVGVLVGVPGGISPPPPGKEVEAMLVRLRAMIAGEVDDGREAARAPPAPAQARAGPQKAPLDEQHRAAVVARSDDTVRVAARNLEQVVQAAEELLTLKQAMARRARALRRLERGFQTWDKRAFAVRTPLGRVRAAAAPAPRERGAGAGDSLPKVLEFVEWALGYVKIVEDRLRQLGQAAEHDASVAGRQIDDLLAESKSLLMLPFSSVADLLPRPVRDLAHEQDKEVELRTSGGEVRLDKRVLEQMTDALLHLVRNAIDHGVESPGQRAQLGKPARATLSIEASLLHGNLVEIVVADDGRGMDPQRLREAAVRRGLVGEEAARRLDDSQALELAFRSDLSTSTAVTGVSGRGLGLAIVRERVERLGGEIAVENHAPHGTRFRIRLPQNLAVFRGVLVRVARRGFVVPTTHVQRVARIARSDVRTVENRETASIAGRAVSLVRLAEVLELENGRVERQDGFVEAVLVGTAKEQVAFAVDEILHDEEVLARPLRPPLVRVRNVVGATILASGEVLPILNVADLVKSARRAGAAPRPAAAAPARPRSSPATKVLLAEDSITSRLLLKGILEGEGCEVKTAADGVEAFAVLRSEPFDLLVSDVEMPRMNGFDLTARIRADRALGDLPVVLVTARASREDRERGFDMGADAYIAKGGFDQRELIGTVRRLAGTRERA